jgi:hypothetical protein
MPLIMIADSRFRFRFHNWLILAPRGTKCRTWRVLRESSVNVRHDLSEWCMNLLTKEERSQYDEEGCALRSWLPSVGVTCEGTLEGSERTKCSPVRGDGSILG